jgi:hypothetical protein
MLAQYSISPLNALPFVAFLLLNNFFLLNLTLAVTHTHYQEDAEYKRSRFEGKQALVADGKRAGGVRFGVWSARTAAGVEPLVARTPSRGNAGGQQPLALLLRPGLFETLTADATAH